MPSQEAVQALVETFRTTPENPLLIKSGMEMLSFSYSEKESLNGHEIKIDSSNGRITFTVSKIDHPSKFDIEEYIGVVQENCQNEPHVPMQPSPNRRHGVDKGTGEEAKEVSNATYFARIVDISGKPDHFGSRGTYLSPSEIEIEKIGLKNDVVYGLYVATKTSPLE